MTTSPTTAPTAAAKVIRRRSIWKRSISLGRPSAPELIVALARNLNVMVNAGVSVAMSLEKIAETMESDDDHLATILRQAQYNVQSKGMELGDAFAPYARYLGDPFVELMNAGGKT